MFYGKPHSCPSGNGYFHRFRRWAQILILEIRQCIPVVKIIARLELDETISFPDGHHLENNKEDYDDNTSSTRNIL